MNRVDVKSVQVLLGHASLTMTMKYSREQARGPTGETQQIHVVLNWFEELKRRRSDGQGRLF